MIASLNDRTIRWQTIDIEASSSALRLAPYMKTALTRLCLVVVFTIPALCMSIAEPSPIPERFSAHIGGFLGASYSLELQNGVLTYTTFGKGHMNPKHETITPTEAQWREFRKALDDLRIWKWHAEYPSNGVVDGTQWSLDIGYADHALHTHGDNNYPDDTGEPNRAPEFTKAFNRYLAAVQKLLGGQTFQ